MADPDIVIQQIKQEQDIFSKAKLLHNLVYDKQIRIVDLAKKLSINPSYVCHILRLFNLPDIIVDGYYSKLITLSHLFVISRIKNKDTLIEVYEKILTNNLTVAQTETLVRERLYQVQSGGKKISSEEIASLLDGVKTLDHDLNLKIIQTRIRGKIIFEIKGNPEKTTLIIQSILKKIK